jgi:hypothetical protein
MYIYIYIYIYMYIHIYDKIYCIDLMDYSVDNGPTKDNTIYERKSILNIQLLLT